MSDPPFSRYPTPEPDELPRDIREQIDEVSERSGFTPNIFLALARRPDEYRAFMAYHDALMLRDGGLSAAEKEMIVVATSGGNDCLYCVVAHGAILRVRTRDPLIAEQIATNYRKANISERHRAMLEFAMKVSRDSGAVTEADIEALSEHGFDEEDTWDIASIAAFFALGNRMANFLTLRPNAEFYTLGR